MLYFTHGIQCKFHLGWGSPCLDCPKRWYSRISSGKWFFGCTYWACPFCSSRINWTQQNSSNSLIFLQCSTTRNGISIMAEYEKCVREILLLNGCYFVRHDKGDHDIYYSPITNRNFTVDSKIKSRHTPMPSWSKAVSIIIFNIIFRGREPLYWSAGFSCTFAVARRASTQWDSLKSLNISRFSGL